MIWVIHRWWHLKGPPIQLRVIYTRREDIPFTLVLGDEDAKATISKRKKN